MSNMPKSRSVYLGVALCVLALLTGCAGSGGPSATSTPTPTATAAPTATPTPALGSISGSLMYPASVLPSLAIYAFSTTDAHTFFHIQTAAGQNTYTITGVPAGTYHVLAYSSVGSPGLAGGYSRAVPCGLSVSCNDHTLIDVVVHAGEAVTGIGPNGWYAPEGTFPPRPAS